MKLRTHLSVNLHGSSALDRHEQTRSAVADSEDACSKGRIKIVLLKLSKHRSKMRTVTVASDGYEQQAKLTFGDASQLVASTPYKDSSRACWCNYTVQIVRNSQERSCVLAEPKKNLTANLVSAWKQSMGDGEKGVVKPEAWRGRCCVQESTSEVIIYKLKVANSSMKPEEEFGDFQLMVHQIYKCPR
ncbi:hypothetical protein GUJ93_ZPchr0001g30713 [Zizania palustris]|uniref:Uncharacterized protein n=1 Tax=Zizania palustris TaxID=103762 RepID=A0A8J5V0X2_ZIZPA|nr:hypothetical protein GUJ93_ZPchr0001g30713 [Zizania palustris]